MPTRILHLPTMPEGHAQALSAAERRMGYDSVVAWFGGAGCDDADIR